MTGIGSYRVVDSNTNQDSDFTSADLIGENSNHTKINTYTAEVRLASSYDGPLNFLIGGFYFHEDIDIDGQLTFGKDFRNYANILAAGNYTSLERPLGFPVGTFGKQGQGRFENYDYQNRAVSVFGQVDYELVDGLVFTAGGNYTNDRKDVVTNNVSTDVFSSLDLAALGTAVFGVPAALNNDPRFNPLLGLRGLQFIPPFLNFPNSVEDGKTRDSNFSYTLRVAYKIDDRFSTYATYATGFKASSWNLSRDSRPFPGDLPALRTAGLTVNNLTTGTRYAGPENAEVYEVGLKGNFDGFVFNAAVFQQALKGFQGNIFTGTGFVLSNAEKQSTFGVELDTSFTPIRALNITASLTYLNPKFDSFTGGSALTPTFGTAPTDLSGKRPAGIPEFSIAVGGTYTAPISDRAKLIFHADYNHESNVDIAQGNSFYRRQVESLNAAITLALGNGLEATAWGRNLTDAAYLTTIFPSVAQSGSLSGYRSQPRTYGGSLRYRF